MKKRIMQWGSFLWEKFRGLSAEHKIPIVIAPLVLLTFCGLVIRHRVITGRWKPQAIENQMVSAAEASKPPVMTPSVTATPVKTASPKTPTPIITPTPTPKVSPTVISVVTVTPTPGPTEEVVVAEVAPLVNLVGTAKPSPNPTKTPAATDTATNTPTDTPTTSPSPSPSSTDSPTITPTATPTGSPTPSPVKGPERPKVKRVLGSRPPVEKSSANQPDPNAADFNARMGERLKKSNPAQPARPSARQAPIRQRQAAPPLETAPSARRKKNQRPVYDNRDLCPCTSRTPRSYNNNCGCGDNGRVCSKEDCPCHD